MLLKVNTSNTDYSGIHAIDMQKMISMHSVGLTRFDIVFEGGYRNQNPVFSFTINSNKANEVMNCIFNRVAEGMRSSNPICTLYDEYSNYKCCTDITAVAVKTRKV